MTIDRIEHVEHLDQVAFPFKGLPRVACVLIPPLQGLQEVEDAFYDILGMRDLDTADLAALRLWAGAVGQPLTTDDAERLRALVKTRVLINRSRGRRADWQRVVKILWPAATEFWLRPFDGGIDFAIAATVEAWQVDVLREAFASGLLLRVVAAPTSGGFGFGFGAGWGDDWSDVP